MTELPGGVWPAMFTPLDDDLSPNLTEIDRLVELFVEQGMDGLYVLGSTGHGIALPMDVRRAVAERAVAAAGGRIVVMIHVGAVATHDAVELAEHAASIGADAVSSVPPIFFPCTAEGVFEHYRRIASASSLPFYAYHIALLNTGFTSAADYVKRLCGVPNLAGIKYTDHDLYRLGLICAEANDRLRVYSGPDELVCHAALCGAVGAIGTSYNVFGPAVRKVRRALAAGEPGSFDRAARFMRAYQSAISRFLVDGGIYHFMRTAMKLRYGIEIGPGAAPSCAVGRTWDEAETRELCDAVDAAAEAG